MGWTSFSMHEDVKYWFKSQWSYENSDYEVVDCALVHRQTMYGAIRQKSTGNIFCAVFLVRWSKGYYNFSYKDMTEFSGPYVFDCPEKIFKLLTPLDDTTDPNKYAREWRAKVMYNIARRKQLHGNVTFETKSPLLFSNGEAYTLFRKEGKNYYRGEIVDDLFIKKHRVHMRPLEYEIKIIKTK